MATARDGSCSSAVDCLRSLLRSASCASAVHGVSIAGATITGFPYVSRGLAAQTLKFWQFYAPGGGVPSQDKWFEGVVKAWNDSHEVKIQLVYVPNSAYMDGTKLPTAFASGTVQYPRVASYSVSSRTPLAKAILIRRGRTLHAVRDLRSPRRFIRRFRFAAELLSH